jgi:uncharacterized protein (DUF885 family)
MSAAATAPIFGICDRLVEAIAKQSPCRATMMGVRGHDDRWDDLGPRGAGERGDLLRGALREIEALPPETERWAKLATRVAIEYLKDELMPYEHGEEVLDLNSIDSSFQLLRLSFDVMPRDTDEQWERVIARLHGLPAAAASYRALLDEGRRTDRTVARRQVVAVAQQARSLAADEAMFIGAPPALADRVAAGAELTRRAFAELAGWLEETYLPAARPRDPVGAERYARTARRFLGMDLDLHETYAWGWREIASIDAKMAAVAQQILPGQPVPAVIDLLKTDPERCAPTLDRFLELMRERQARALSDLTSHFDVPDPIRAIEVRRAPPGGSIGAYYVPPSEDFSRPGTVWYSPDREEMLPLFDEISTAYHEGFPGHHLQGGLAVYLADRLSRLHRLAVLYPGHAEGWALYAEELMNELGYFERPDYVLGMYAAKIMRACRVVVDIGLHLELPLPDGSAWSFDRAAAFLVERGFLSEAHARSEVTRYLGWPGQAISYKVGERVILELREEARRKPGFSLREFHDKIVGSGSIGLGLLKEL